MPTFTRKVLARGIKVMREHVYPTAVAIKESLNAATLDQTNIAAPRTPWHVHFNMPVMDSRIYAQIITPQQPVEICFPFVLLPPQDQYNADATHTPDTVTLSLDSVVLSFEQRAEAGGIADQYAEDLLVNNGPVGAVKTTLAQGYTISLRISEKLPVQYGGQSPFLSERDVFSGTFDALAALSPDGGFNPFVWQNLAHQLDCYKTYILRISAPALTGTDAKLLAGLVSLNVDINGYGSLMARDVGADVQNLPDVNSDIADTVTIDVPAAGSQIQGDGQSSINAALTTLDRKLLNRLWTGYGADSSRGPVGNFAKEAGYEVIAVPMFQNAGKVNRFVSGIADLAPFQDGTSPDACVDMRIVRLAYPFVVHHVIAISSYACPPCDNPFYGPSTEPGFHPGSATLTQSVGVAIGTGLRGDTFARQQLAFRTWTDDTTPQPFDVFKQVQNGVLSQPPSGSGSPYDFDYRLLPIPLIGADGNGPEPQGTPFYVGKATTLYASRQVVDKNVTDVIPDTHGLEQWLEVRWSFDDTAGLGGPTIGGGATTDLDVYAGAGGNWVLILGKKHLAGGKIDLTV